MQEEIKQQLEPQKNAQQGAPKYVALIPAAGVGSRMGKNTPKQYLTIAGQSILQHTVNAFLNFDGVSHTYVVVSPDDAYVDDFLQPSPRLSVLRCGGDTRRDSVRNGLAAIAKETKGDDWIMVHDAARPGLTAGLLSKLLSEVGTSTVGGLLALPVVDTVKRVVDGKVHTISRDGMWLAQTPQMFRFQLLCDALDAADQVTDEASAVEAAGHIPLLIEGHVCNLKVTLPADLEQVSKYLK
ncbi:2-C-methyl-D-erythritol 4-phosphate cytidylyltransferase [Undibacterium sp. SXout11W]|uniref:2-C-methyl-D-erythritol 4-phosphate cytidylyltransferase n=1 Tax=Undibacterium sp. SXout11W TaxID=3413050 RepID=UPI003BF1931D